MWKGRDEEGKKEMKANQLLVLEELEEPRVERTWWWGWGKGPGATGWKGRGGGAGGAGPGAVGGEDRFPVWLGPGVGLYRGEVRTPAAGSSEAGWGCKRRDGAGIWAGAVCAKAQRQETRSRALRGVVRAH